MGYNDHMNHETNYACIIFDFFGVLCSEVAPIWLPRYLSSEDARDVKATVVGAADRGEISQEVLFQQLQSITGVSARVIETEWLECAVLNQPVVELARRLSAQYRLALLTNAPAPFVRRLLQVHQLSDLFEHIVVSSEERCAKPDARIYELILSRLGLSAEQTLLIDDNEHNIEGARQVGMDGILFRTCDDLEQELRERVLV
jgi:HAD superfamily hydrolase (TIGR01509 family)